MPLESLSRELSQYRRFVIVEESAKDASIHDALAEYLRQIAPVQRIDSVDLGDAYVPHGNMESLYQHYGLDGKSLAEHILEVDQVEN